jgi:hypothetical protein
MSDTIDHSAVDRDPRSLAERLQDLSDAEFDTWARIQWARFVHMAAKMEVINSEMKRRGGPRFTLIDGGDE